MAPELVGVWLNKLQAIILIVLISLLPFPDMDNLLTA